MPHQTTPGLLPKTIPHTMSEFQEERLDVRPLSNAIIYAALVPRKRVVSVTILLPPN